MDEGIVEPEPHLTDDIPADFPGIPLESDSPDTPAVVNPPPLTDWAIAEQVLANANLTSPSNSAEISGVDLPINDTPDILAVMDDEGYDEEEDENSIMEDIPGDLLVHDAQHGHTVNVNNNIFHPNENLGEDGMEHDEGSDESNVDDGDEPQACKVPQNDSHQRYPLRNCKKKKQTKRRIIIRRRRNKKKKKNKKKEETQDRKSVV
jgi:hypothetical protein